MALAALARAIGVTLPRAVNVTIEDLKTKQLIGIEGYSDSFV